MAEYDSVNFGIWDIQTAGSFFLKAPDKILSLDWTYDSEYVIVVCMKIGAITLYSTPNLTHLCSIITMHKKTMYLLSDTKNLYIFSCGTNQDKNIKFLEIALHKINIKV